MSQPIVELDQTSLPVAAVELSQPPAEETSNENANFVEEGDSNHVLGPEDIVADPALRKPIEEMHPNIRDDAKRELLGTFVELKFFVDAHAYNLKELVVWLEQLIHFQPENKKKSLSL